MSQHTPDGWIERNSWDGPEDYAPDYTGELSDADEEAERIKATNEWFDSLPNAAAEQDAREMGIVPEKEAA